MDGRPAGHSVRAAVSGLLAGKTILVVGDETGLSPAIGERAAAEGACVERASAGGSIWVPDECAALFAAATQKSDRKDVAGVDGLVVALDAWVAALPEETVGAPWEELVDRALTAPARLAAYGAAHLVPGGAVILVSDIFAFAAHPLLGAAGATKAGLSPLSKTLAQTGAARQVRSNLVVAGVVETAGCRQKLASLSAAAGSGKDAFGEFASRSASGRALVADEIAASIAFLLSSRARFINGVTIFADGGLLHA